MTQLFLLTVFGLYSHFRAFGQVRIVFRMDDVLLQQQPLVDTVLRIFEKNRYKLNVGVIPVYEGKKLTAPEKLALLKSGITDGIFEIHQHGYAHLKGKTDEFSDLSLEEQQSRILDGKKWLEKNLNIAVQGFSPPWNSHNELTLTALEKTGFRVVSANIFAPVANRKVSYLPVTLSDWTRLNDIIQREKSTAYSVIVMMHASDFTAEGRLAQLDSTLKMLTETGFNGHHFSRLEGLPEFNRETIILYQSPLMRYSRKLGFTLTNEEILQPAGQLKKWKWLQQGLGAVFILISLVSIVKLIKWFKGKIPVLP